MKKRSFAGRAWALMMLLLLLPLVPFEFIFVFVRGGCLACADLWREAWYD